MQKRLEVCILLKHVMAMSAMPEQFFARSTVETAIQLKHRCLPVYQGTAFVREKTDLGEIIWEGRVEVFDLKCDDKITRCYGWINNVPHGSKVVTVMENRFVNSPLRAVQAALFMGIQQPTGKVADGSKFPEKKQLEIQEHLREAGIKGEELGAIIDSSVQAAEHYIPKPPPTDLDRAA